MADAAAKIEAALSTDDLKAFEGDAHAFLMSIYKSPDPDIPLAVKVDAAGKAIRYEKPALASVGMTATHEVGNSVSALMERIAAAGRKVHD